MTQDDLAHYKVKCTQYVLLMSLSPNVHPVLLYDQPFLRYKVAKNHKCTECPQTDLDHLMVKLKYPQYTKY